MLDWLFLVVIRKKEHLSGWNDMSQSCSHFQGHFSLNIFIHFITMAMQIQLTDTLMFVCIIGRSYFIVYNAVICE